nr:MAG TPA: hypothetical protein [Caudoviricetes sp.]
MNTVKFNDKAIRELFKQYVRSFEDKERHSEESVRRAEEFDDFCSSHINGSSITKFNVYVKMTDVAVEFEEDGFVAGFKTAMSLIFEQEQPKIQEPIKTTLDSKQTKHKAVKAKYSQSNNRECFITSIHIGKVFRKVNFSVEE